MGTFVDTHIPLEVLQHIVRHLDPVALIALSQTSRSWRALISPIRHDFVRRLLTLELLPDHGGLVPRFDERSQKLTPPWEADEWRTARYACCGCMKLRTHMMFDNHAILRRPYRKPPPGSVEAERAAVTDWEPLEPRVRWQHIHGRALRDERRRRELARAAARPHDSPAPPAHAFALVPQTDGGAIREAEIHLAGIARHRRRCIECQRRRGHWRRKPHPHRGTQDVPVVISRQLRFRGLWERYFPGLFEAPESQPRIWRAVLGSRHDLPITLYVVRCPSCGDWQELAAFRTWTPDYVAFGSRPDASPVGDCNRCYLQVHRDPDLLGRELAAGALRILHSCLASTRYCLRFGWRLIYRDFTGARAPFAQYSLIREQILGGLAYDRAGEIVMEDSDLPDLRRRLHRYRDFIYEEVGPDARADVLQGWFRPWLEDYELWETMYCWLKQHIARVEAEPHLVLDYTLKRDPYRI